MSTVKNKMKSHKKIEWKKIIKSIFKSFILIIIGGIITFYVSQFLASTQINIIVSVDNKVLDNYIPIRLINNGGKSLKDIQILVKSCNLEDENYTYFIPELMPSQEYVIEFDHKKTIEEFRKLDCNSQEVNLSMMKSEVKFYKDKLSGKIIMPDQNFKQYGCGYCFWDIYITSKNYNNYFRLKTFSPVEVEIGVTGKDGKLDISSKDVEYVTTVNFSFFSLEDITKLSCGKERTLILLNENEK